MKISKIISAKSNIHKSINSSMNSERKPNIVNMLDACGCTGNGLC